MSQTTQPAGALSNFTAGDIVVVISCISGVLLPAIGALMKLYFDGKRTQRQVTEMKADVKTNSQAAAALIDINKTLPTPDVDHAIEAAVKASASPTIDEDK